MSLMYTEGTSDYIAATPVLVVTYAASGSITAGRIVQFDAGNNSTDVYQPAAAITGSTIPIAGLALATVANGDPCPTLVFGMAKNLTKALSTQTSNPGHVLFLSGAGYVSSNTYANHVVSVSSLGSAAIGRVISGSGTYIVAFINTMK